MMKIEHMTCIWMFVYAMNFWAARNGKKLNFSLFRPNLHESGLFHPYFVCKCSFREISMIKIIFDQSKPISLYLKIKKLKIEKSEISKIACLLFIKNGNKTSIQPILKLNSTSFMFNNIFYEMHIKKVVHWGNGGTILISSWNCNFSIYLDIQAISTLLCLLLVLDV